MRAMFTETFIVRVINRRINGPVVHLGLFVLRKKVRFMVTTLNTETHGYDSGQFEKPFGSLSYSNLVWNLGFIYLAKQVLNIKHGFDKLHTKYQRPGPCKK